MTDSLTLEVSVEQLAAVIHRMPPETRQALVALAPELIEAAGLVTTVTYYPDDGGYLARCVSLDAIAWGSTLGEVYEELVDAVIETSEILVENVPNPALSLQQRLPYARIVYQYRHDHDRVKALLGLIDNGV